MRIDTETFTDLCVSLKRLSEGWLSLVQTITYGNDTSTARELAERMYMDMARVQKQVDTLEALLRAVLAAQPVAADGKALQ
jgi:hypothetical protein